MTSLANGNFTLEDMDRASVFHPVTSIGDHNRKGPAIYQKASGSWVHDRQGRKLLDLGAGLWCVNIGYGREEMAQAAADAIRDLSYYHAFGSASNEPMIRVADRILTLLREQSGIAMSRVLFGTSGSDANDTAVKLIRYYHNLLGKPQKKKIISRLGAYHGVTVASGSLTGISAYHAAFDLPQPGVLHVGCPHFLDFAQPGEDEAAFCDRLIAELRETILREGPETIAAFIAEPIMGTGGVLLPPAGYFEAVQELLEEHDILLVSDEVITGFGRTGEWFASGSYGLRPDIISLAKGLTSAYQPMSASVIGQKMWSVFEEHSEAAGIFMHGFTYSGHPVAAAVALANLDIMQKENLVSRAKAAGDHLLASLRARIGNHPLVRDIRGRGLMVAVELNQADVTRSKGAAANLHRIVAGLAAERGVLTRALPFLPVNSFSPPLCIANAEIDHGVDVYAAALDQALAEIK